MTFVRPLVASEVTRGKSINFPSSLASRPLEHSVVGALFALIVVMMFTLSGSVLWDLGLNYSGLTGAAASKIHPATYLSVVTFALLVLARRNPASYFVTLVTRHPGALVFLIAISLLGCFIVLDNRRGIATVFDTYLLAVMLSLIAAELNVQQLTRVEKLIHILLAANALLALLEYFIDYRIFPHRFEGVAFDWDRRSTALLGHPLENAQTTGLYIMALVAGGGSSMPKPLRLPAILLQLAAMVPFGGRTALLLTVTMIACWMVPHALRFLRGGHVSLPVVAMVALLTPVLALAIGLFATSGFFNVVLDRFADDGGSAQTRVEMFEIFSKLNLGDIFIGANSDLIDSIRRTHGLEWGIENPIVRLVLYQGAALTTFLVAGFILFLIEIGHRLRRGTAMPFIFFVIVINSYESISNKTIMLGHFVALILVMFSAGQSSPLASRMPRARKRVAA
jgi:hypothetical protein